MLKLIEKNSKNARTVSVEEAAIFILAAKWNYDSILAVKPKGVVIHLCSETLPKVLLITGNDSQQVQQLKFFVQDIQGEFDSPHSLVNQKLGVSASVEIDEFVVAIRSGDYDSPLLLRVMTSYFASQLAVA